MNGSPYEWPGNVAGLAGGVGPGDPVDFGLGNAGDLRAKSNRPDSSVGDQLPHGYG